MWGPSKSMSVETNCSPPNCLIVSVWISRISASCLKIRIAIGSRIGLSTNPGTRTRNWIVATIRVTKSVIGVSAVVTTM